MEMYKLFTKEPIRAIEDIIINGAMLAVFEKLRKYTQKENKTFSRQNIFNNIRLLTSIGLKFLRNEGQSDKQLYELYHGCILAHFLNTAFPAFTHNLFYPQDESYDFLITRYPREKQPDLQFTDREVHKKGVVFKIEFTEAVSTESFKSAILSKLDSAHDYKGRILLVSAAFTEGYVNFQQLSDDILKVKQDNFQTIWVLGQTDTPNNPKKMCYLIAELIKHKKIVSLFELPIDWNRIKSEINAALTQ